MTRNGKNVLPHISRVMVVGQQVVWRGMVDMRPASMVRNIPISCQVNKGLFQTVRNFSQYFIFVMSV